MSPNCLTGVMEMCGNGGYADMEEDYDSYNECLENEAAAQCNIEMD